MDTRGCYGTLFFCGRTQQTVPLFTKFSAVKISQKSMKRTVYADLRCGDEHFSQFFSFFSSHFSESLYSCGFWESLASSSLVSSFFCVSEEPLFMRFFGLLLTFEKRFFLNFFSIFLK